jgi:hypothetical protein
LGRIEAVNRRIENGISEIKAIVQRTMTTSRDSGDRVILELTHILFVFRIHYAEAANMVNRMEKAQITAKWSSIGIDDWIKAGRWWLLKVRVFKLKYYGLALLSSDPGE